VIAARIQAVEEAMKQIVTDHEALQTKMGSLEGERYTPVEICRLLKVDVAHLNLSKHNWDLERAELREAIQKLKKDVTPLRDELDSLQRTQVLTPESVRDELRSWSSTSVDRSTPSHTFRFG
jgi:chromosome segregation ATPase